MLGIVCEVWNWIESDDGNPEIRQSLIYSSLVAWTMVQMNRRTSVWCSKHYFFHHLFQNTLQKAFQFILLFFHKITKIKLKSFEYCKSIKSLKKITLGTSDAWSTIHLSHRPSVTTNMSTITSALGAFIYDVRFLGR